MLCSIMKCKKAVGIRIFVFGCALLCGCQPNPTDPVVANKNDGAMESAINRTIEDSSSEYTQSRSLEQGKKVESFAGADSAVQVDVNFEYTSINKDAPVIRVIPHSISSEEAQKYTQVLFQGQPAYEDNLNLSKSEIETKILELKQFASDEEALADRFNNNQEDIEEAKEYYQKNIDFYKDLYENAPEHAEPALTDWKFKPMSFYRTFVSSFENTEEDFKYDQTLRLQLVTTLPKGNAQVNVSNRTYEDYRLHNIAYYYDNAYQNSPLTQKEEEAIETARKLLSNMGLNAWELGSCVKAESHLLGEDRYWYEVTFIPIYEQWPLLRQEQLALINHDSLEDQYAADYYYEEMTVRISSGEVAYFYWQSPMDIVSVENAAVETKKFEEVYNIFKKQMQTEYTVGKLERSSGLYNEGELEAAKVHITEADMGLARIRVKDHLEEYRLVPVWVFRGNVDYESSVGSFKEDTSHVLVTVNAIDGSIINTVKGY